MTKPRKQKIAELLALQTGKISPADILPERIFHWYVDEDNRYNGIVKGHSVSFTEEEYKAFKSTCQGRIKNIVHIHQPGNDPLL